jgi:outer membrane immunogenic protein
VIAGASFGNAKTDFNVAPVTVTSVTAIIGFGWIVPGFSGSDTVYPSGFMGGGQIGYNWQFSPIWVVGLEADFQGALERDSATVAPVPFNVLAGELRVTGETDTNYQAKIPWFGTARVRIGYVWGNGEVMSYVTGGLAYGEVDLEGSATTVSSFPSTSITNAFGHSQVNAGWTVGYGTEGRIDFWGLRNWTWKVEGLYMDLGTLDTTSVTSGVSFASNITAVTGGQVTTHTHFTDGILRGGLNYKFY